MFRVKTCQKLFVDTFLTFFDTHFCLLGLLSYTAGSRNGLEGMGVGVPGLKIIKKGVPDHQKGAPPKVQNPKIGLPITPRPFWSGPLCFAIPPSPFTIFGRAVGQIFRKVWVLAPLGLVTLVCRHTADIRTHLKSQAPQGVSLLGGSLDWVPVWAWVKHSSLIQWTMLLG